MKIIEMATESKLSIELKENKEEIKRLETEITSWKNTFDFAVEHKRTFTAKYAFQRKENLSKQHEGLLKLVELQEQQLKSIQND